MSELAHLHRCPACGEIRDCSVMIDRALYARPCWPCVASGRTTWPPADAARGEAQ